VRAGDSVGVTSDGAAQAVDASSFGMVMDQADADGLAWVLVGFD
jgi:hypothetical protein